MSHRENYPDTATQNHLLQRVLEPSGMTLEQLVQRMAYYIRVQKLCTETLAKDEVRGRQLWARTFTSEARQANVVAPGSSIYVFGDPGTESYRPDDLRKALEQYDEMIQREPSSYEDHFWRATYCSSAAIFFYKYMIAGAIRSIPRSHMIYTKRLAQLVMTSHAHTLPPLQVTTEDADQRENRIPVHFQAAGSGVRITASRAKDLLMDIRTLSSFQFKLLEVPHDTVEDVESVDRRSWKLVSEHYHSSSYSVVFAESQVPIEVTKAELLDLLLGSELVQ
ncbi:hypothetical protein CERSUDRAFT_99068 [Gelatoporia subvermispora B]|uniref:Uncharacterized protein n=1 Tax=Ceriporiopsis subvermispora (strain B) TaxID=914234 RepID=M2R376_CERS8|nr:hypothetical protein CERSUDRAFT_99068 [Gelatoporia subvermispora B]